MKTDYLVLIFYFTYGNGIIPTNAANLLGAVGSVIGLGNDDNNNYRAPTGNNQFLNPNFNGNNRPNNNPFVAKPNFNGNNNFGKPINNNNFGQPINNNNFGKPINNNNFGKPTNNNGISPFRGNDALAGLTEEEKQAAKQYPGIANLLSKLRELNKQKELEKQNGGNGISGGNGSNNNNDQNGVSTKNGWKVLERRKFVFQAKAVRPDNEVVLANDKVYYYE